MPIEGEPITWVIDNQTIEIKYPKKLYWKDSGISKIELVEYYKNMADIMLPYFKNRPITLHYFPRGIDNSLQFYKRNVTHVPKDIVKLVSYKEKSQDKVISLPVIFSAVGLLYFAAKGVIEFHLWNSKYTSFEMPDIAVFDLDIDSISNFKQVVKVALIINNYLNELNLVSFCKTTGGTGLHVYVPINPIYNHQQVRDWVRFVGEELSGKYPDLITTKSIGRKTHISNKVTIDYLQNTISRTMISPYSVRGYKNATVSTPLLWDELKNNDFLPEDFNLKTIPKRLAEIGDVFKGVLTVKQELPV